MIEMHREVRLTRSGGDPVTAEAFEVVDTEPAEPSPGEVLVRVDHFSLDPYQGIRLRALDMGAVPPAGGVGQVVASRHPELAEGTWVTGEVGWRDHAKISAEQLTMIDPVPGIPLHLYVGLLGLSGLTAYFGVTRVLRPEPDEKIIVSGAYGGVGQVACQIARRAGADVLGLAGGDEKRAALEALEIPSVDHRADSWLEEVIDWAPAGADGYFDNVWGSTSARVVEQLRPLARIALCGQMSGLVHGRVPPLDIDWYLLLTRSLTLQGFRTVDYLSEWSAARAELAEWCRADEIRQDVRLVEGLENAGSAFDDLINGRSVGKTIVSPRPSVRSENDDERLGTDRSSTAMP